MKPYYQDKWVTIYHGDCREVLPQLDVKVDLNWTSPPYFVGKKYEAYISNYVMYLDLLRSVWLCVKQVLGLGRFIVVNVAHSASKNTPARISCQLEDIGFTFEDDIIWEKPDGISPRFGSFIQNPYATWYLPNQTYEHLLVYTNGEPLRERVTPLDTSFALRYRGDIWRQRPQTNSNHEAPFSEQLSEAVISFYSNKNGLILDPFLGSGTTCFCAKKLNRYSIGIEIEEKYCEIAARRCQQMVLEFDSIDTKTIASC